MGTVQFPSEIDPFENDCVVDERQQQKKKKKYEKTKGKLRKAGFDPDDILKSKMIEMQPRFKEIAEEQLRQTRVGPFNCTDENNANFVKLKPMERFEDLLTLNDTTWRAMDHYNIKEPTPVQKVAIPYIVDFKSDLIVKAQTGSGKTFAFLLPIIDKIIEIKRQVRDTSPNKTSPYAVIVSPTAELTHQLACDATRLVRDLYDVNVSFGFGGLDMRDSRDMLNKGCDLLFVPPGRLYHYFFEQGEFAKPLLDTKNIRYVVLDEADRLLAYKKMTPQNKEGHTSSSSSDEQEQEEPQNEEPLKEEEGEITVDNFRRILEDFVVKKLANNQDFHVFMFSATLKYDKFRPFVVTDNCTVISVGNDHPAMTVKQNFIEIKYEHEKNELLFNLLEMISEQLKSNTSNDGSSLRRIEKTLIFVNNKRQGERIAHGLLTQGYSVASINSDRSIRQRFGVIDDLLNGVIDIVVATDVLSRGINIPRVDYVINFDFPHKFSSQEYVHRVGRCGRIGNIGQAFTLFDPKKDFASAKTLIAGCKATNQAIPDVLLRCLERQSPNNHNFGFDQYNVMNNNTRLNPPKFFNNNGVNQQNYNVNSNQNYYDKQRQSPQNNYGNQRQSPQNHYGSRPQYNNYGYQRQSPQNYEYQRQSPQNHYGPRPQQQNHYDPRQRQSPQQENYPYNNRRSDWAADTVRHNVCASVNY